MFRIDDGNQAIFRLDGFAVFDVVCIGHKAKARWITVVGHDCAPEIIRKAFICIYDFKHHHAAWCSGSFEALYLGDVITSWLNRGEVATTKHQ
ncbi:hypothetical protein TH2_15887 [Thalassospira profundimaris WP0211]|nr:hypothetical protein TH2_15887 [Thalassospira profundimaris WP0211]